LVAPLIKIARLNETSIARGRMKARDILFAPAELGSSVSESVPEPSDFTYAHRS